ncbi:MAG: hypothetical protein ILO34_06710, partial [Kiritimatiellae bacterium]|nr:hypothetical protein [Kiritimatiellia bacterium]
MTEKESEFLDRIASVLEVPSATRETELRSAPYWSSLTAYALIVTREQRIDRQNFTEDWLLYLNRDDDVDYCEEP